MERGDEAHQERYDGQLEGDWTVEKTYISMLQDSLEKKIDVLRQLQTLCQEQTDVLQDMDMMPEDFEEIVDKKAVLIERLADLDQGFEQLFDSVKEEITSKKEEHREAILRMQELIRDITDRSNHIQVMEARNKDLVQRRFGEIRNQAREIRQSGKAVSSYYNNMMRMNTVDPQFMDSKK